jgi:hypothetical protein
VFSAGGIATYRKVSMFQDMSDNACGLRQRNLVQRVMRVPFRLCTGHCLVMLQTECQANPRAQEIINFGKRDASHF